MLPAVTLVQSVHIRAGIAPGLDSNSEAYTTADTYMGMTTALFLLVLFCEFLVEFSGATLFNNMMNLLVIVVHVTGVLALLYFSQARSHYYWLGYQIVPFGLLPLTLESGSAVRAKLNYRRHGQRA